MTRNSAVPQPGAPTQLGLFPRKTVIEFPRAKLTADSLGEAEADDGHRYYLKGDVNGIPVRASEWICTHLAERVGIATPQAMPIERSAGDIVFGSRRVAGVADDIITANYLLTPVQSNIAQGAQGLAALLSSIYAFDMFVFNEDRHFGNYLSLDDNGVRRFYAFDFSRALFWRWPWSDFPEPFQNTRTHAARLWPNHPFDIAAAGGVLDRLEAISASILSGLAAQMPPDWGSSPLINEFLTWWDSPKRTKRLAALRKGVSDGTLL